MLAFDERLVAVATLEIAVVLAKATGLALLEPADPFVEEGAEEAILIICSHATLRHVVKQFLQGHILRRLTAVLALAFALSVLAAFVVLAFSLCGRPDHLSRPRQGCKASDHQQLFAALVMYVSSGGGIPAPTVKEPRLSWATTCQSFWSAAMICWTVVYL